MKKIYMILAAALVAASFSAQAENAWGLQGSGTEADPYQISTAADLLAIANNITADNKGTGEYFKMMNDIDMNGAACPSIAKAGITNVTTVTYGFNGTFDGNSKTITGINHTANGNDEAGKFNSVFSAIDENGVVKNLIIGGKNTISAYNYTAGVASLCKGTIEDCINYADITGSNAFAAGICGYVIRATGKIKNCVNYGNIKAMTYACGICGGTQAFSGANYAYEISGNINYGNLSTTNGVGSSGIIGVFTNGILKNNTNYGNADDSNGKATSRLYTAGIVANLTCFQEMTDNVNSGEIKGIKYVGGIVGSVAKNTSIPVTSLVISGNTNEGAVSGDLNVAGIVGNTTQAQDVVTIANCTNRGVVTCTDTATVGNLRGNSLIALGEGNVIAAGLTRYSLDPVATGITEVSATKATKARKVIENGQIFIIAGDKKYNLMGVEVK